MQETLQIVNKMREQAAAQQTATTNLQQTEATHFSPAETGQLPSNKIDLNPERSAQADNLAQQTLSQLRQNEGQALPRSRSQRIYRDFLGQSARLHGAIKRGGAAVERCRCY